jgi:TRAP transporter TAXI family solute receptor
MTIRIGASELGGTFYTQALALKEVFGRVPALPPVEIVESRVGASIENAIRLDARVLDLAFVSAPWVAAAKKGIAPFSRSIDLKTVAPMNLGPNFFVARADSTLRNVTDLRGRKLAIGLKTGGMTPHADAVLKALGLGPNDLERVHVDFAEGARMLISGEVDAQYQRPVPNRIMTELSEKIPVRVLRYEPQQIEAALKAVPCDRPTLMTKGSIRGLEEDIPQLGVLNLLVTHAAAREEIIRLVVRTIIENASELGVRLPLFAGLRDLLVTTRRERCALLQFDGVTLHPGAARAYADAGYIAG